MTEEQTIDPPKVEEIVDWKDKYFRTLAEMENMRKRMQKERQEIARFGIENAIGEFIPAIDNFENALRFVESAGPEVKNWAIGFEMILSQFKEVLHNIRQHAGAAKVDILLSQSARNLCLRVADDGCGFEAGGGSRGRGLANIESRAKGCGGRLRVETAPGSGTTVTLMHPLK